MQSGSRCCRQSSLLLTCVQVQGARAELVDQLSPIVSVYAHAGTPPTHQLRHLPSIPQRWSVGGPVLDQRTVRLCIHIACGSCTTCVWRRRRSGGRWRRPQPGRRDLVLPRLDLAVGCGPAGQPGDETRVVAVLGGARGHLSSKMSSHINRSAIHASFLAAVEHERQGGCARRCPCFCFGCSGQTCCSPALLLAKYRCAWAFLCTESFGAWQAGLFLY
jgi:hypothetical protein